MLLRRDPVEEYRLLNHKIAEGSIFSHDYSSLEGTRDAGGDVGRNYKSRGPHSSHPSATKNEFTEKIDIAATIYPTNPPWYLRRDALERRCEFLKSKIANVRSRDLFGYFDTQACTTNCLCSRKQTSEKIFIIQSMFDGPFQRIDQLVRQECIAARTSLRKLFRSIQEEEHL